MVEPTTRRFIGHAPDADGRFSCTVPRLVTHGEPVTFRTLCERAVPTDTRYLVLDLDRTLHLARNMGELLGWEIGAYHSYGPSHLERVEPRRRPGRFFLDPGRPLAMSKYLARGARGWAYPGLYYLFCDKLAERRERTQRWQFRTFGSEPHLVLQSIPGVALLHEIAGLPLATVRALADRVFARYADDQVIERADLDWLRGRCRDITIILSSASPQPIVEAAAAALGFDECHFTELPLHDGRFAAPFHLSRLFLRQREPEHIAPPSGLRFNAGYAKIDRLRARHPDAFAPGARTVGITDTWQGEDHCWAHYFARVVDINSITPFPPLVATGAPLEEVHSAHVLTRGERTAGERDPRRARLPTERARSLDGVDIAAHLGTISSQIETLAERRHTLALELAACRMTAAADADNADAILEHAVAAYNESSGRARKRSLAAVHRGLRGRRLALRARAQAERPLSALAFETKRLLAQARSATSSRPEQTVGLDRCPGGHRDAYSSG